ncbi:uncharacterized protein [Rutidosis leptorrhynchoides]|uniref:uncharacterized protein n=1 Tax=Rutidosis leptorrhynchoides TaxID=125765 RepID=UPI003A99DE2F
MVYQFRVTSHCAFDISPNVAIVFLQSNQINYNLGARSVLGGELNFVTTLITSRFMISRYPYNNEDLKRIIFFVGGPVTESIEHAEAFGKAVKQEGIAVDVVNFYPKERKDGYWARVLDAFVAAANNNNNSHIKHVRPHAWTLSTDVLSRNSEILPGASLAEEEIRRLETNTPTSSKTVGVEQPGKHNELYNISTVTNSAIISSITSDINGEIASEINVKDVRGKKKQVAATNYGDDDDDDDDDDKYDIDDDDDDEYVEGEQRNEKAKKVGKGMWLMVAVVCYLFIYNLG